MTMDVNKVAFQQRVARINSGKQWAPEGVVVSRRQQAQRRKTAAAANPVTLLLALVLGAVIVVAVRYARFHAFEGGAVSGDILMDNMVMDAVMAVALSLIVKIAANLRAFIHLPVMAAGIAVAALCMHMAVHRVPDLFAQAFSDAWVASITQATDANTVLVLDLSI